MKEKTITQLSGFILVLYIIILILIIFILIKYIIGWEKMNKKNYININWDMSFKINKSKTYDFLWLTFWFVVNLGMITCMIISAYNHSYRNTHEFVTLDTLLFQYFLWSFFVFFIPVSILFIKRTKWTANTKDRLAGIGTPQECYVFIAINLLRYNF